MSDDRSPSIEFQTDLRIGDIYWLFFAGAIRRMTYGRWILAMVFVVALALGEDRLGFLRPLLEPPLAYLLLGLLLYLAFVRPFVRSRSFIRQTMGIAGKASYVLSETGIEIRHPESQSYCDWAAVRLAKQTSGVIILFFEGNRSLVFPKRCFASPAQLSKARAIIATHVTQRPKPPYSWP
jgi:YcxB-like protein